MRNLFLGLPALVNSLDQFGDFVFMAGPVNLILNIGPMDLEKPVLPPVANALEYVHRDPQELATSITAQHTKNIDNPTSTGCLSAKSQKFISFPLILRHNSIGFRNEFDCRITEIRKIFLVHRTKGNRLRDHNRKPLHHHWRDQTHIQLYKAVE